MTQNFECDMNLAISPITQSEKPNYHLNWTSSIHQYFYRFSVFSSNITITALIHYQVCTYDYIHCLQSHGCHAITQKFNFNHKDKEFHVINSYLMRDRDRLLKGLRCSNMIRLTVSKKIFFWYKNFICFHDH